MDLYLPATDAATLLRWTTADFRAVRRCLKPPLPVQRGHRTGRGKTPDLIELEPLLKWLNKVLSNGLSDNLAEALAERAEPII